MIPYNELSEYTSIPDAFAKNNFPVGKYFVIMGAAFSLLAGITSQLFPLPRILYSMATDRVIFGFLGKINERTETPLIACVITGVLTAFLALLLDLISLVEMLSIGTLLAYTIVALCVLLLRYRPGKAGIQIDRSESVCEEQEINTDVEMPAEREDTAVVEKESDAKHSGSGDEPKQSVLPKKNGTAIRNRLILFYKRLSGWQLTEPTEESYNVVKIALAVFVILSITVEICLIYGLNSFTALHPVLFALVIFLFLSIFFVAQVISCQPQSKNKIPFKVPLVPLVPLLSMFVNLYLILMLSFYTWIRFAVWMIIGKNLFVFNRS